MATLDPPSDTFKQKWTTDLVGKKIVDQRSDDPEHFCKQDLPEQNRVIAPGTLVTRDFRPQRMNVHLDDEDRCSHITFG
ncbi:hypothetical protein DRE_02200 [Drechslerella stenobrocha 248]|uniref:Peptidase inhibitor I78 family protein n=1 Tax=Drechslerella stenobrocha 248 TaxID=1043628 RepID=W7HW83_9PEZI|nr:hypothetical protein DRE_02200 [Drechslerella stenobrocha 248]